MNNHIRKKISLVVIIVFGLLLITGFQSLLAKKITILQTADIHGHIYPWSYKIGEHADDVGLAKANSIINEIKSKNPNTLLVDSGDTIQGTTLTSIFKDRKDKVNPMIKTMNYMKYDASVLGNHEFNFGLKTLDRIMDDASFPVLSANIVQKKDGSQYHEPYVIKKVAGINVGILGLTTPNIPRWDGDKVASLNFHGMSETASKYIPEMKKQGADIIIALAHGGLEGRHHPTGGDKVKKIAEENPEIAAIFCGHDHVKVNTTVNGVLITAPEDAGEQVVRVDLKVKKENGTWKIKEKTAKHIATENYKADTGVLEVARPYHQETVDYVNTPIGLATGDFAPASSVKGIPTAQIKDTALMDLINRVQLKYTDADISSAALFTWDSNIEKGPVSIKDAARIYKYSNTLYKVPITGKELKEYMEWSAAYYNTYQPGDVTVSFDPQIRGYNYDMFAGVDYKIDISRPAGDRITDLTYNGKPVKDDQRFTLAVNNYRYSGLKSQGILSSEPLFKSKKSIRQYIIDYIREKEIIKPRVDNNWKIIGADLNHWAKAEAITLLNKDILQIPSKNRSWNGASLNLEEKVDRATLIKSIVNMFNLDIPEKIENPDFTDIGEDLIPYARAAKNAGLLNDFTEKLNPNNIVTREEAVTMMVNALNIVNRDKLDILHKYSDKQKIDQENKDEFARALNMDLINGYPGGKLYPDYAIDMGELATLLHNLMAKYKKIDVLSTNDFHGKLIAGYEAGAAKLAGAIKHYRKTNPDGTLLLDGGDSYQGTPLSTLNHGDPVIEIYNYLDYQAQAIGNHEFDWGIETLKEINKKSDYPLLSANLFNKHTAEQVKWTRPYLMNLINNTKVGIIGISTPDTENTTMPSHIKDLKFKDPVPVINKWSNILEKKGAELILVLSHMPGKMDFDTGKLSGELIEVAAGVKNVDGLIGGHSHHTVTGVVNGIPVIEAYKHGRELGNLRYYINKNTGKVYKTEPVSHPVRKSVIKIEPDPEVQKIVDRYKKELEPIMSEVLTTSRTKLKRKYNNISNIGSLITDVMKEEAGTDIAFQNPGGIRIDIPAGKIRVEDIYSLLPFGNTIVTAEMTGKQIINILEQSFTLDKGMMQLSGLNVEYDPDKSEYNRVLNVTLPDGTPLKMDKKYTVATNNFLAEGGDQYSTFKEAEFTNTYKKVRDAVIEYLRSKDTVNPAIDDRVININKEAFISNLNPAA